MSRPSTNPLRQVLDATGQSPAWVGYTGWGVHYLAEGYGFRFTVGPNACDDAIREHGGEAAVEEWQALLKRVEPIVTAAMGTPPMALRGDWQAAFTAAPATLSSVLQASWEGKEWAPTYLTGAFSLLMTDLKSKWLVDWLDYLSFALSGLDSTGTIAAAVVYTLGDLHRPGAVLDYPLGGSEAVVEALCDAVRAPTQQRKGQQSQASSSPTAVPGEVRLRSAVEEILVENGRAVGVRTRAGPGGRPGVVVRAREGVISNAPIWDTLKLLPTPRPSDPPAVTAWRETAAKTPATGSFVHMHLAIDGEGLPPDLDCHHSVISDWSLGITAADNMYIISIPSLLDPSLAPPGKHVVHVYGAANEPYANWQGLSRDRGPKDTGNDQTAAYTAAKAKAAEPLWRALEAVIPDVRERVEITMVGTPLTHQHFTRRHEGTYGPSGGEVEGDLKFMGSATPIPGLKLCGDSCFPGIGVPAAAASGIIAAHCFVPLSQHLAQLEDMREDGTLCAGREWWIDPKQDELPMAPGGRISVLCAEGSPDSVRYA